MPATIRRPRRLRTLLLLALSGCVSRARGEVRASASHQQARLQQDQIVLRHDGELDRADAGERMRQDLDEQMLGGAAARRLGALRPVPPIPTGLRCPGPPCPVNWNLTLEPQRGPNNNAQQSPAVVTISGDVRLLPGHSEFRHGKRERESRRICQRDVPRKWWNGNLDSSNGTHVSHPGVELRANLMSISHRCHLFEVAFVWELTKETIHLPLGCLQGGICGPSAPTTGAVLGAIAPTKHLEGPVDPSFRALSGRLKFTVRRHKFNKDSPSRA